MSTPAEWETALSKAPAAFYIRLERLGTDAFCRALSSAEAAECVEMGGERGARYAFWLACADLREAGELMRKKGSVLSAFDFTEKLPYADVMAAAAAIFDRSGANAPLVTVTGAQDGAESAVPAVSQAVTLDAVPEAFCRREQALRTDARESLTTAESYAQTPVPAGTENRAPVSRHPAAQAYQRTAPLYEPRGDQRFTGAGTDAEQVAAILAERLRDASGNM